MRVDTEPARVLVLDDDSATCELLAEILAAHGYQATCCTKSREALELLANNPFDVLLTDYRLPGASGLEVSAELQKQQPDLPVILLTSYASMDTAIAAIRVGVFDFVPKPVDFQNLSRAVVDSVRRAVEGKSFSAPPLSLRPPDSKRKRDTELIGESPGMARVRSLIDRAANDDASVLVSGERGTEKDVIARAIHLRSARGVAAFEVVDCATLIGGAPGDPGRITRHLEEAVERAACGTLFLDGVGSLPKCAQHELMSFVDACARGSDVRVPRLIASTDTELRALVENGDFRSDLFYRISVVEIEVPPLRERGSDVLLLAEHFLATAGGRRGMSPHTLSKSASDALAAHLWPGNTDELRHAMERAVALGSADVIVCDDLPIPVRPEASRSSSATVAISPTVSLDEMERLYIQRVLTAVGGNKASAARLLGIDRTTLYRKLQRASTSAPSHDS